MRAITLNDIEYGTPVMTVEIPHPEFVRRFGARHADHPENWDAPGPVELWFFELPWGHKITLEYHLAISQVNIYVEALEIEAVLDFLALRGYVCYLHTQTIDELRASYPAYTRDLSPSNLYRLDDNGNTALVRLYESRRVADYYQKTYEAKGHKQLYWVEEEHKA